MGVVRLVGFSTAVRGLLAPSLIELNRRCPDLTVHISEEDPDRALHSVYAGAADLALVHDADGVSVPAPPSVVRRPIHTDFGDVIMKRTHPLARRETALTPAELARYPWVTSRPGRYVTSGFVGCSPRRPPRSTFAISWTTSPRNSRWSKRTMCSLSCLASRARCSVPVSSRLRSSVPPTREVQAAWRRSADASPAIHAVLDVLDAASR
ncbi:LysR substrate-binding domain-containing protein [Rhodococcus sp. BS-15]|uniref:LysR substrate-binding domain-containing protein n=1 Tax=Rhodococcus sp. BS-15 TaxID=1304954 RepID=UPI000AF5FA5D|nr:LysR substrate-binding domain-containing protein [Rhodococcus sp. BS-15]